ncbi:MAG: hypothetical protein ABIN01_19770 [Ferruginibacter sp.]
MKRSPVYKLKPGIQVGIRNIYLMTAFLLLGVSMDAQRVEYSRQRFKLPYYDGMQLVSNIAGYHHLVFFTINQPPAIHVFDGQLQLQEKKNLPFILRQASDVSIIRFRNFFFLYLHQQGSLNHQLWKVSPTGNAVDLSGTFQRFIDTNLLKSTSTLQLVNQGEKLFIIANTYYEVLGKIGSTVLQADQNFRAISSRKIYYEFNSVEQRLKQVMLVGDEMFILKTAADNAGNSLHILKANLNTGRLLINSFNSGSSLFSAPGFKYNAIDSGIIVYAVIDETVFINTLDTLLNSRQPISFQKNQFGKNVSTNFLLVGDKRPQWLNMSIYSGRLTYTPGQLRSWQYEDNSSDGTVSQQPDPYTKYNRLPAETPAIRFTRMNEQLKITKDSVIENTKSRYTLFPGPVAEAVLHNKNVLFLNQTFFENKHGLVMVAVNEANQMAATDIRVFEKYNYMLPQLSGINDGSVILPFTYKKEMGLAKITIEN